MCSLYRSYQQDIIPFKYDTDVSSNMHPCKITYKGQDFASSEHAYQHEKCKILMKNDAVDEILRSPTGRKEYCKSSNF